MTTIICDRHQISADSRLTCEDTIASTVKLFRCKGGVVGVAGDFSEGVSFVAWMKGGKVGKGPDISNVSAVAVTKYGILMYERSCEPYPITDKYAAIGSGSQAALAVMLHGGTTQEAVKIASRVDPYTGGRVRTLVL